MLHAAAQGLRGQSKSKGTVAAEPHMSHRAQIQFAVEVLSDVHAVLGMFTLNWMRGEQIMHGASLRKGCTWISEGLQDSQRRGCMGAAYEFE